MKLDLMYKEVLLNVIENARKELPFSLQVKDLINLGLLPFSAPRIYEMLNRGELPGKKIDGKWIIPATSLLTYLHVKELETKLSDEVRV